MRPRSATYFCLLAALALSTAARAEVAFTCFPANHATRVNPDTHLAVTFSSPPTLGKSGQIRIYDAAGRHLVDTLDLSIPAGPDPSRRIAAPPAAGIALDPAIPTSPTTTTPAVRTTPADLHNYQLTTIGGLADFHFYPVIIHGNVATIYPHNHVLRYKHQYIVQVDSGVSTPRRLLRYAEAVLAARIAKRWRLASAAGCKPAPRNSSRRAKNMMRSSTKRGEGARGGDVLRKG